MRPWIDMSQQELEQLSRNYRYEINHLIIVLNCIDTILEEKKEKENVMENIETVDVGRTVDSDGNVIDLAGGDTKKLTVQERTEPITQDEQDIGAEVQKPTENKLVN